MKLCMVPTFLGEEDPLLIGPKHSSSPSTCLHPVLFGFRVPTVSLLCVSVECSSAGSPIVSKATLSMGA